MSPTEWPDEIDQFTRGEIRRQLRRRLTLDCAPTLIGDRSEFFEEMVHASSPLSEPRPSEPVDATEDDAPSAPMARFSTSVIGNVVKR